MKRDLRAGVRSTLVVAVCVAGVAVPQTQHRADPSHSWQAAPATAGWALAAADSVATPAGENVYLFPSASAPLRQGFVRVINHSAESGEVRVDPTDGSGRRFDALTLSIGANQTVHFNSGDLESGNEGKGLSGRTGAGQGDWALAFSSDLDIEVLAYIRTTDGFLTAMHDVVPASGDVRRIAIFNPGSNRSQVSKLRLVNPTDAMAEITIRGTDDKGVRGSSEVSLSLDAGTAREISGEQLEAGGAGMEGMLGDGSGKWRLEVESEQAVVAMSLLESPTGHLTNLSTIPKAPDDGVHGVPLFPAARDASGRQGFVRVINRSDSDGQARIKAYDDTPRDYEALTLTIGADEAVHFNSDDLEQGNAGKGLSGGIGAGEGNWRLEVTSQLEIEVLSYIRTEDGFLTAMHDVAPSSSHRHRVAVFNPGSNRNQESLLRLVNPGDGSAGVAIAGIDDNGAGGGSAVSLSVPGRGSRTVGAWDLESGAEGLDGALGDGAGKWQLLIRSDRPVVAMSLLRSPTGHVTNLSTAPARGPLGGPRAPMTSYELQKTGLYVDREAIRQANQVDPSIHYVTAIAYGDFDGDGDEDVFMAGGDGTESTSPVELYANDGMGQFTLANELIQGAVPEMVNPRKALSGDFDGDGTLDVFVAGHGYDADPFPGESPVLLLSTEGGLRAVEGLQDWVGFFHGAASADVDYDGDLDVVLTDFGRPILLLNNGHGGFVDDPEAVPWRGAFTTELIDVDLDGYTDLVLAGHEDDDPTEIYWGDQSGRYGDAERTQLPAVPGQDIVVDIDADDLDGDGIRDIVVTRTGGGDNYYRGYYIQLVTGLGNRDFVDATENVVGAQSRDGTTSPHGWIDWVRLQDFDGDGHRDIVVDDAALGLVWINDGHGRFRLSEVTSLNTPVRR